MQIEEFNKLVDRLKDKMYRVSLRIVKYDEEARDVVQDSLVKIWKIRDRLTTIDNVDAYCMMITRNMSIDKLRSRKMETTDISEQYDLKSNTADPERLSIVRDELRMVKKIIDQLPENHKTVLELRDIEGYSYKEISDMTGYTLDKVKVYLYRARLKLKEQLNLKVI
jgi:RNA polymerase sigma-70 factor (ECF subfamily)